MKRIILLLFICILFCGCRMFTRLNENISYLTGEIEVSINVKDYGIINVLLDADNSPITVTNFVSLVNEGFYDGLKFHRIMPGFMIQGGDPNGNGSGGSEKNIKGEFSSNGIENNLKHERGVISMARRSDSNDSASSQFFIMHADNASLDGYYATFGRVISGMEVVDNICKKVIPIDDDGTVNDEDKPIIEYIKVVSNNGKLD